MFGRGHSQIKKAPIVSLPLPHGEGKRIYFNMMTLNYIRWLLLQFYVLLFQFMDILVLFCKHCVKYSNFSRSKMISSPILFVLAPSHFPFGLFPKLNSIRFNYILAMHSTSHFPSEQFRIQWGCLPFCLTLSHRAQRMLNFELSSDMKWIVILPKWMFFMKFIICRNNIYHFGWFCFSLEPIFCWNVAIYAIYFTGIVIGLRFDGNVLIGEEFEGSGLFEFQWNNSTFYSIQSNWKYFNEPFIECSSAQEADDLTIHSDSLNSFATFLNGHKSLI